VPSPVLQAVTSKADIDVKAQGRHVLVTVGTQPGELIIVTEQYVYVLQLRPEPGPAETIVLVDDRTDESAQAGLPAAQAGLHASADYIDELTQLITAVFRNDPVPWATISPVPEKQRLAWVELEIERDLLYSGPAYIIRRSEWRNTGSSTQTLRESSFYTGRELAIALDRLSIAPGESVTGVIVYPAEPKASSADKLAHAERRSRSTTPR
jgi:hypothetical protein